VDRPLLLKDKRLPSQPKAGSQWRRIWDYHARRRRARNDRGEDWYGFPKKSLVMTGG